MESIVRMGEAAIANTPGDVLACIGLGSCIGLALFDRSACVAGLAHIMLPESNSPTDERRHRFADLAVPSLVEMMLENNARRSRLEAAVVGGASMFSFGNNDIGARNDAAVTRLLEEMSIPIAARATGGDKGRTVKVRLGEDCDITVTVRVAGGREEQLMPALAGASAARPALVAGASRPVMARSREGEVIG